MEPITILIYVSTVVIAALWIFLSMVLYRAYSIMTKVDRIIEYIDHIKDTLRSWEAIPTKFIAKMLKKHF
ncbi:MAG: hypothetical protein ACD_2C00001G0018 [uncultured bacterium (gcode 4)]|uniref:Uncharacterized protein n=1 Tax=uncultured bacterium (gcode 4) TaxID=1234023 RepID=K2G525_9BACT|nr:MAG: hypothetical protein ACD_2C00001G0018 [uncultured bacterium (gcode 4)]